MSTLIKDWTNRELTPELRCRIAEMEPCDSPDCPAEGSRLLLFAPIGEDRFCVEAYVPVDAVDEMLRRLPLRDLYNVARVSVLIGVSWDTILKNLTVAAETQHTAADGIPPHLLALSIPQLLGIRRQIIATDPVFVVQMLRRISTKGTA